MRQEVHQLLSRCIRETLRVIRGGYLCREQPGDLKYMVVFGSPQVGRLAAWALGAAAWEQLWLGVSAQCLWQLLAAPAILSCCCRPRWSGRCCCSLRCCTCPGRRTSCPWRHSCRSRTQQGGCCSAARASRWACAAARPRPSCPTTWAGRTTTAPPSTRRPGGQPWPAACLRRLLGHKLMLGAYSPGGPWAAGSQAAPACAGATA